MEFATLENRVNDREASIRPISHCDRNGAVELDHESSRDAKQYIVKCNDLRPVGIGRCLRFGMDSRDGGLKCIGSEPASSPSFAARRIRSIALKRPAETSQDTGFSGMPSTGH